MSTLCLSPQMLCLFFYLKRVILEPVAMFLWLCALEVCWLFHINEHKHLVVTDGGIKNWRRQHVITARDGNAVSPPPPPPPPPPPTLSPLPPHRQSTRLH